MATQTTEKVMLLAQGQDHSTRVWSACHEDDAVECIRKQASSLPVTRTGLNPPTSFQSGHLKNAWHWRGCIASLQERMHRISQRQEAVGYCPSVHLVVHICPDLHTAMHRS